MNFRIYNRNLKKKLNNSRDKIVKLYILAQNVMTIAELAFKFRILWLLDVCDREMIKWVDIPLIDRLIFADRLGLNELKVYICQYDKIPFSIDRSP